MKNNIELKPCPFCGGKAILDKSYTIKDRVFVICDKCLARTQEFAADLEYCANDEAIKAWNSRISEKEKDPCSAATEQEPDAVDTAKD